MNSDLKSKVNNIITLAKKDLSEVENFANEKGIFLSLPNENLINKRLKKEFPELSLLYNYNHHLIDGIKDLLRDIEDAINNKEYYFLDKIGFINLNKDIMKLKENSIYYLYLTKTVFGFEVEYKVINKYKNGNTEIKIIKGLEELKKIINFSNKETETIIKGINEEEIKEYKRMKKEKYLNEHSLIYVVAKRLGLNIYKIKPNFYLIDKKIIGVKV